MHLLIQTNMESDGSNRVFTDAEEEILRELRLDYMDLKRESKTRIILKKYIAVEECSIDCDCAICMSTHISADVCVINCGHKFGSQCLALWKNNTCPLCRTTITVVTEFRTQSFLELVLAYKLD